MVTLNMCEMSITKHTFFFFQEVILCSLCRIQEHSQSFYFK